MIARVFNQNTYSWPDNTKRLVGYLPL